MKQSGTLLHLSAAATEAIHDARPIGVSIEVCRANLARYWIALETPPLTWWGRFKWRLALVLLNF